MAGRVLSKKNESALRDALKALTDVLGQLGDDASDEAKEAVKGLREAANLGDSLEARIHVQFVAAVDDLFGYGKLTRQERQDMLAALELALQSFSASVQELAPQVYQRSPWADADMTVATEAMVESDCVPLKEAVLRTDDTAKIKLIRPGWGSSGYYPKEVLRRDGPKVFTAGTQMFWNHATPTEESQRPEGSLDGLAGQLVSDAAWQDDTEGGGLYADARVFGRYKEAVEELAPYIGVSIRALGKATAGEAEGRKGAIVNELTAARSVDYVTVAGAGGKIVEMFEAARTGVPVKTKPTEERMTAEESAKLNEAHAQIARLTEALLLRDASGFATRALASEQLPDVTKARLVESLSANPPVKEGALDKDAFAQRIKEAAQAEREYLAKAAGHGGQVQGMGAAQPAQPTAEDVQKRMAEAFKAIGLNDKSAQIAANGRG